MQDQNIHELLRLTDESKWISLMNFKTVWRAMYSYMAIVSSFGTHQAPPFFWDSKKFSLEVYSLDLWYLLSCSSQSTHWTHAAQAVVAGTGSRRPGLRILQNDLFRGGIWDVLLIFTRTCFCYLLHVLVFLVICISLHLSTCLTGFLACMSMIPYQHGERNPNR